MRGELMADEEAKCEAVRALLAAGGVKARESVFAAGVVQPRLTAVRHGG